jgi:putative addiction module killer protein/probable addiction module antidote protein
LITKVVKREIDKLALGITSHIKPLEAGLYELKIHIAKGIRIYFVQQREEIILLLWGGDKTTQQQDIERAKKIKSKIRGIKMKNRIILTDFNDSFSKRLSKNPKELKEYKEYVISEFEKDQNKELLLAGLKAIAAAAETMNGLAKKTKMSRRNLYKIFSKDGNPTLNTFFEILRALDLKIKIAC